MIFMAFENLNVDSLRSSLNSCKSSINHSITDEMISNVVNDNVWLCDSRNNLRNALSRLADIYHQLENELNKHISTCNMIESYKKLEQDNIRLENEYNQLNGRLYYNEQYERWYYEPEADKWLSTMDTRRVKDYNVERQMQEIRRKIDENKGYMETHKNNIYSSVSM